MEKYFRQFVQTATKKECEELVKRLERQKYFELKRLLEKVMIT